MTQEAKIEFKHVDMTYLSPERIVHALRDISFSVKAGEFVSILGPSGCGKSSILSLIAGLIAPTSGSIYVDGKPIQGSSLKIGYMLQQDYLLEWRTIRKNILLGLEIQQKLTRESEEFALQLLDEIGLSAFANHYPSELSGGMRQRVALVRTLATNPEILLLDEPFSALDFTTRLKLEDLVYETLHHYGKTALLVTHDISEAISMSDRIIVMGKNPGHLIETIELPPSLRAASPLMSREIPGFQYYFHLVWKVMNPDDE